MSIIRISTKLRTTWKTRMADCSHHNFDDCSRGPRPPSDARHLLKWQNDIREAPFKKYLKNKDRRKRKNVNFGFADRFLDVKYWVFRILY
ncbi:hypothetical protein NQ318_012661 [Aromia moschata]|uniref:Uncharacterized protein n=1 Tax=Aromia moschata TaxID=1265417 RepID=A0AAV8X7R6_9CUCU|nr:hypothetical protein NQ318_012661 [Aromia moschata]